MALADSLQSILPVHRSPRRFSSPARKKSRQPPTTSLSNLEVQQGTKSAPVAFQQRFASLFGWGNSTQRGRRRFSYQPIGIFGFGNESGNGEFSGRANSPERLDHCLHMTPAIIV